jgi:hypothetical protein
MVTAHGLVGYRMDAAHGRAAGTYTGELPELPGRGPASGGIVRPAGQAVVNAGDIGLAGWLAG